MREKNGFIATSVLYAFLVAFLTLFLGFMASFIQNKQLINRIEDMAREDLDTYGNVRISNLKIGDYVVLDTLDDEGDGLTATTLYSSPIDPNTKWILYKINETTEEVKVKDGDTEKTVIRPVTDYYFVSDANAQKFTPIATANIPSTFSIGDGKTMTSAIREPNLKTLSQLMNYNIYYDMSSKTYISLPTTTTTAKRSGKYAKVMNYQFLYNKNDGVDIKFLDYTESFYIRGLSDEKLQKAVFDQNTNYVIWLEPEIAAAYGLTNGGFAKIGYSMFTKEENTTKADFIAMGCDTDVYSIYGHKYSNANWYDKCYYLDYVIGDCINENHWECTSKDTAFNPRYVAIIRVNEAGDSTDGYIDSGNGTSVLPYLITKGVKK